MTKALKVERKTKWLIAGVGSLIVGLLVGLFLPVLAAQGYIPTIPVGAWMMPSVILLTGSFMCLMCSTTRTERWLVACVVFLAMILPISISCVSMTTNESLVPDDQLFHQLFSEPIESLNLTELNFMVDYCTWRFNKQDARATLALVYQNQIIILLLSDDKEGK